MKPVLSIWTAVILLAVLLLVPVPQAARQNGSSALAQKGRRGPGWGSMDFLPEWQYSRQRYADRVSRDIQLSVAQRNDRRA